MADDIKKIIESLDKSQGNLKKSRGTLSQWLDEVGYQMEVVNEQKNLWSELSKQDNVSPQVTVSGYNMARSLEQNTEEIAMWIDDSNIDQSITTASAIVQSGAGTAISGATLSYPPDKLPQSYFRLDKVVSQRNDQSGVSQKLKLIDLSLADEYDNAWLGLHSTPRDETRSPLFLIREVVNRLYHHYAPDDEVRVYNHLDNGDKITRRHRVDYIASQVNSWKKQTFLDEEKAFLDIYGELSRAHKHGEIDGSKTRGLLYQANGLIKLLLELL